MSEASKRNKTGKPSIRPMGTGLVLIFLIMIGSLLWHWIFPRFEPVVVQAATAAAKPDLGTGAAPAAAASGSAAADPADLIPIHLVGAVRNPGIYLVARGSYLYQLVEQAGGLAEGAAVESINLAMKLDSNQHIYLPTREEIAADPELAVDPGTMTTAGPLIDLNQATLDDLDSLPGIGPSTATAILEFRKKNGSFQCVEDLMQIPGIKESRFNAIKDLVVVR
ncbi:MAG TPA: hypothetical protein DD640_06840 [Clostridiales bacterium]|nr:hypothetical protein [Clostridiales bacterium]